jgi:hypothetical protein
VELVEFAVSAADSLRRSVSAAAVVHFVHLGRAYCVLGREHRVSGDEMHVGNGKRGDILRDHTIA